MRYRALFLSVVLLAFGSCGPAVDGGEFETRTSAITVSTCGDMISGRKICDETWYLDYASCVCDEVMETIQMDGTYEIEDEDKTFNQCLGMVLPSQFGMCSAFEDFYEFEKMICETGLADAESCRQNGFDTPDDDGGTTRPDGGGGDKRVPRYRKL